MLRLIYTVKRGNRAFRRYQHDRRGVVETLTIGRVVYVRPNFGTGGKGLLRPKKLCRSRKRAVQ